MNFYPDTFCLLKGDTFCKCSVVCHSVRFGENFHVINTRYYLEPQEVSVLNVTL